MQVSPTEIEDTLMVQPDKLIEAASVGGVSGGRTSDEKVPRAWVVLSEAGRRRGEREVIRVLDDWVKENLSKYKHLRGGIEIIDEVSTTSPLSVVRTDSVSLADSDKSFWQSTASGAAGAVRE